MSRRLTTSPAIVVDRRLFASTLTAMLKDGTARMARGTETFLTAMVPTHNEKENDGGGEQSGEHYPPNESTVARLGRLRPDCK